jgi:uncharacterized protein (DUF2267 family)
MVTIPTGASAPSGPGANPVSRTPFAFLSAIRTSGLPPDVGADRAAAAVFCALAVRLPAVVATRFQAALPEELREGFRPCGPEHAGPPEGFGRDEYLRRVGEHLDVGARDAEDVTRSVFAGTRRLLPTRAGSMALAKLLPADLAVLWDDEEALEEAGASIPLNAP